MATTIECDSGHKDYGTRRKAARQISLNGSLERCYRCGGNKHYLISHYYPYDKTTAKYKVISVYTLLSDAEAEREGWDPMMFLMKNLDSGEVIVWPYYWTKNRRGKWANGQFPPLLTVSHIKKAIEKFGITP